MTLTPINIAVANNSAWTSSALISEWLAWWNGASLKRKTLPALGTALYWLILYKLGGLRSDHVNIGVVFVFFNYAGPRARPLYQFILPLLLTGVVYDSQRYWGHYVRGPVHIREPYDFDLMLFGIETPQGRLTPNEWWQINTHPVLDLITGFFYLTFIALYLLFAGYVRFWVSRVGTAKKSATQVLREAPRIMWAFFWVNCLGYSTYYWYAAAPPWYVAQYGFGPANHDALPSAAGCLRFDALLGTDVFANMYSRSADVFGAIPSLHVAYPFLAFLCALRLGTGRVFAAIFFLMVSFSAVYLNHHYILDILWGAAYSAIIFWIVNWYEDRKNLPQIRAV